MISVDRNHPEEDEVDRKAPTMSENPDRKAPATPEKADPPTRETNRKSNRRTRATAARNALARKQKKIDLKMRD